MVWSSIRVSQEREFPSEKRHHLILSTGLSVRDFTAGGIAQLILVSLTNGIMKLLSLVHSSHNNPLSAYVKISTYKSKIASDATFYFQNSTWDVLITPLLDPWMLKTAPIAKC
jgi:hypothetical protein